MSGSPPLLIDARATVLPRSSDQRIDCSAGRLIFVSTPTTDLRPDRATVRKAIWPGYLRGARLCSRISAHTSAHEAHLVGSATARTGCGDLHGLNATYSGDVLCRTFSRLEGASVTVPTGDEVHEARIDCVYSDGATGAVYAESSIAVVDLDAAQRGGVIHRVKRKVVALRVRCTCDWIGENWPVGNTTNYEPRTIRFLNHSLEPADRDILLASWFQHFHAETAITRVRSAFREYQAAAARLEAALTVARSLNLAVPDADPTLFDGLSTMSPGDHMPEG